MMRVLRSALLSLAVFDAAAQLAPAVEPVAPAKFQSLHALIKPGPDEEKFLQIPWLTSLGQARKKAAEQGKPILLWEMDGHPLGCV